MSLFCSITIAAVGRFSRVCELSGRVGRFPACPRKGAERLGGPSPPFIYSCSDFRSFILSFFILSFFDSFSRVSDAPRRPTPARRHDTPRIAHGTAHSPRLPPHTHKPQHCRIGGSPSVCTSPRETRFGRERRASPRETRFAERDALRRERRQTRFGERDALRRERRASARETRFCERDALRRERHSHRETLSPKHHRNAISPRARAHAPARLSSP